jgi:L-asparaginase
MRKLHVFTTGGTIDKLYFDALSEFQIGDPIIGGILQQMNVGFDYQVDELMRRDSLDMTDEDRRHIQTQVCESQAQHILIMHGTDGMVETADWLGGFHNKIIILTGALQPAAFSDTDAIFNVGCAVGALQAMSTGVYIAMNGQIFAADKVIKNRIKHRFESLTDG